MTQNKIKGTLTPEQKEAIAAEMQVAVGPNQDTGAAPLTTLTEQVSAETLAEAGLFLPEDLLLLSEALDSYTITLTHAIAQAKSETSLLNPLPGQIERVNRLTDKLTKVNQLNSRLSATLSEFFPS